MVFGKGKKKKAKEEVPEQEDESIDMPDEEQEEEEIEEIEKRIKELELKEKAIAKKEVPEIEPAKEATEVPMPKYRPMFNSSDIKDSAILRVLLERVNYLTQLVETEIAKE